MKFKKDEIINRVKDGKKALKEKHEECVEKWSEFAQNHPLLYTIVGALKGAMVGTIVGTAVVWLLKKLGFYKWIERM